MVNSQYSAEKVFRVYARAIDGVAHRFSGVEISSGVSVVYPSALINPPLKNINLLQRKRKGATESPAYRVDCHDKSQHGLHLLVSEKL